MKRKTNIFYLNGDDTRFLTFSNYAEYMTGNFLSVNTKLNITKFICLNLPFKKDNNGNNYEDVKKFKIFLMQYYENKLAFIRDELIKENSNVENIYPLKYLFDALISYFSDKLGSSSLFINYISDITEQNYNGSYSDNICVVNLSKYYCCTVKSYNDTLIQTDQILYGWDNEVDLLKNIIYGDEEINDDNKNYICQMIDNSDEHPYNIYDNDNGPQLISNANDQIIYSSQNKSLTFNCIIPMFRMLNIDEKQNDQYSNDDNIIDFDLNRDIPMGIWFNEVDDEQGNKQVEPIKLYKSGEFSQSWSLVISSKFSAFPYGITNQINSNDNTEREERELATYAELLGNHAKLLKQMNQVVIDNIQLSNDIVELKQKIKTLESFTTIDSIKDYIDEEVNNQTSDIKETLNSLEEKLNYIKWKYIN